MTSRHESLMAARAEGEALLALLGDLTGQDWEQSTDCTEWTARGFGF
jgi:outer membrane protease